VELAAIGLDLDEPSDIAEFMQIPSATATRRLLETQWETACAETAEGLAS
jgi:hypothetical protein